MDKLNKNDILIRFDPFRKSKISYSPEAMESVRKAFQERKEMLMMENLRRLMSDDEIK